MLLYMIRLLLDIKPNDKFLDFLDKLIEKADFSEKAQEKVLDMVKKLKEKKLVKPKNTTASLPPSKKLE